MQITHYRTFVMLLSMLLGSLAGLYSQDYKGRIVIQGRELSQRGDSLILDFDMRIESRAVESSERVRIVPQLQGGSNSRSFPYVEIRGSNKDKMQKRSDKLGKTQAEPVPLYSAILAESKTDTVITYRYRGLYEDWMDDARLVLRQETESYKGKRRSVVTSFNNRVGLTIGEPYRIIPHVAYLLPPAEEKKRDISGTAFLDFRAGSSVIDASYLRNPEELAKIRRIIDSIRSDSDYRITGLSITGYASVEGSYAVNEDLSRRRAFALKDYMHQRLGIRTAQDQTRVEWTGEDWDTLVRLLEGRNDFAYRDQILMIIRHTDIFEGREKLLMDLAGGVPYRQMEKELFPLLRRVEYRIDFTVRPYNETESRNLLGKHMNSLSQRELFLAAQSYGLESTEFAEIIEAIYQMYPDSPTAANNMGALYLLNGDTANARKCLYRAPDGAIKENNTGILLMLEGYYQAAEESLKRAQQDGCREAALNLTELAKKRKDDERQKKIEQRRAKNNE